MEKHPLPSSPASTPTATSEAPPLQATLPTLISTLRGASRGSSPGCDGWRFEHFRLLLDDEDLLSDFLKICNLFLDGSIPAIAATAFSGARLIALKKNKEDVRPIAVGSVFRRTVAKLACRQLKDRMSRYFAPFQFGVATPGGSEQMIHLFQLIATQHPDWIILKTDAKNAFNSVNRQTFLNLVAQDFPSLSAFVNACYVKSPTLSWLCPDGIRRISSAEGVQQGDPLGPFLFSLALHPSILKAQSVIGSGFVASYLDDAVLAGPRDDVVKAFKVLEQSMSDTGLRIRSDKCEAFCCVRDTDWPLRRIPFVNDGFCVLGSPIGSEEFVARMCVAKVGQEKEFLQKLALLQNIQSACLLLRYCGVGKITHLLRTIPPHLIRHAAQNHDSDVLTSFQSILGCNLSPSQVRQVRIKIAQGGFGLSSAAAVSPCAFVASWAATLKLLPNRLQLMSSLPDVLIGTSDSLFNGYVFDALRSLSWTSPKIAAEFPSLASLPEKHLKLQKYLSSACQEVELGRLLESLDKASQARLRSAGGPISGAWLDALPQSKELSFTNAEFQTAALLRLGADIPLLRQIRRCNCGAESVADGYHLLTCPKDGGPIRRHDSWQHTWQQMLRSVNYRVELEQEREFQDKKRPDIGIYNFENGKKLLLDISVIHPLSQAVVTGSAQENGYAAAHRDKTKDEKYLQVATSLGYLFKPVVVEVFGRWSPTAASLFHQIARRPSVDFMNDRNGFINYWSKRLAVCLQRANSRIILNKVELIIPTHHSPVLPSPSPVDVRCFTTHHSL